MPDIDSFATIAEGQVLPGLEIEIDRLALVKYAGASDDYVRQHWDHPFMIAEGYPDVIGHGWLTFAHMCRAVTEWAPPSVAAISAYDVRYHKPFYPGLLACGGQVESVTEKGAVLSLWARDAGGTTLATGSISLVPVTRSAMKPE